MTPSEKMPSVAKSRRSSPKTRTGCGTCKYGFSLWSCCRMSADLRQNPKGEDTLLFPAPSSLTLLLSKVKCGEERPHCLRCIRFGCTCDGYEHLKQQTRSRQKEARSLFPSRYLVAKNPFVPLFNNGKESRYFENFCSKTSYEILPNFNSGTLRQMLLQAAREELSIRYAVVALGALDVTTEHMPNLGSLAALDHTEERYAHLLTALEQYNIAIKHMQSAALNRGEDVRRSLLECLVTLCFEAWNGNHTMAVMQVQNALKIIFARRHGILASKTKTLGNHTYEIEADLLRAFTGLDVHTLCSPSGNPPEDLVEDGSGSAYTEPNTFELEERKVLSRMPYHFTSLQDAQICRNALKLQVMRFLSVHAPEVPPSNEFEVNAWWGPWKSAPRGTQKIYEVLSTDICRWNDAFKTLWTKLKSTGQSTRVPASLLKLQILGMSIALLVAGISDEAEFDEHTEDFSEVTNLAEYVLENSKTTRHKFFLDTHVVLPLYVTAHKCRDAKIRRKAVALLMKHPRREGVWDSLFSGKLAQWVMELEETCLQCGKVPGWARIRGLRVVRDGSEQVIAACEQRISEDSEVMVARTLILRDCGR